MNQGSALELVLVLGLDLELPMAPVGPLREYHPPIVLHTSRLTPLSSSIMWEVPVPLCTYARIGEDCGTSNQKENE
jgi:hypothetical protein